MRSSNSSISTAAYGKTCSSPSSVTSLAERRRLSALPPTSALPLEFFLMIVSCTKGARSFFVPESITVCCRLMRLERISTAGSCASCAWLSSRISPIASPKRLVSELALSSIARSEMQKYASSRTPERTSERPIPLTSVSRWRYVSSVSAACPCSETSEIVSVRVLPRALTRSSSCFVPQRSGARSPTSSSRTSTRSSCFELWSEPRRAPTERSSTTRLPAGSSQQ
mmetsp:Transcript_44800/g.118287  ORF Transcript_44800/g.118287 Transcript_44800/m.118287 type:complete len:226 (-) Transcript_44800:67-744(-)